MTAEAAAVLERTAHTVGYFARAGELPFMKDDRGLLVRADAVHERAGQAKL